MKKALLIWNLALTALLAGIVINGCSELDPRYSNLEAAVESNRVAIEQVADYAKENRSLINSNTQEVLKNTTTVKTLGTTTETALNAVQSSLNNYINQNIEAYLGQYINDLVTQLVQQMVPGS